jgi:alanine-glyoxylate transaminase/serine-glyoxylate transaminase/serine-pyruvate transaminase
MPPDLAPITFGKRAEEAIAKRKQKVQSWYLDMTLVRDYWNSAYTITPVDQHDLCVHEGLRLILEGSGETWHSTRMARALHMGAEAMG